MQFNCVLIFFSVCSLMRVIASDAIPQAPASAPALPNIPGLSAIVDDLMKVVEKAKSRWDALSQSSSGLSLGNLLFPNRKRGPSRADPMSIGQQNNPFQALLDNEVNSLRLPLPYQFKTEPQIRRSSQVSPMPSTGVVFIPKNVGPSVKLIHRPLTPVSNCLYGQTGTLCQDLSGFQLSDNPKDWEDLFSNIQLTEY